MHVKTDNEFEDSKDELEEPEINTDINAAAKNEHVGDMERPIRTLKERWRAHNARLPHEKKPKTTIRAIGCHCIKWLNSFPGKGGVSENMSPRKNMTGKDVRCGKDCQPEVGQCVQAHECPDPANGPEDYRSVGAMALGPSENEQGGCHFMSSETGKKIHC